MEKLDAIGLDFLLGSARMVPPVLVDVSTCFIWRNYVVNCSFVCKGISVIQRTLKSANLTYVWKYKNDGPPP